MSADSFDEHEYKPAKDLTTKAQREQYWQVGFGLQAVDNLQVSRYAEQVSRQYVEGNASLDQTRALLSSYHNQPGTQDTLEADMVSQRIVELLAAQPFYLAPDILSYIHAYLFQDLSADVYHPGTYKTQRMIKQEDILNGDSVLYADPSAYESSLTMIFNAEREKTYTNLDDKELKSFCHTIAFLWQIHPFYEGNTRTVAVFAELYLNYLGFVIQNDPFAYAARYFRNALVRSMYRNPQADIFPDESFLVLFFQNILGRADAVLDSSDLVCTALFENPQLLKNVPVEYALQTRS